MLGRKGLGLRLLALAGALALAALIYRISAPPERPIPAVEHQNPEITRVISLAQGDLTGVYTQDKAVEVYAGIPYAKPPVGELRWREPQAPEPWEGVLACDHFAPMSMQPRTSPLWASLTDLFGYHRFQLSLKDNFLEPMSEDSLYLNIWKPAGDQKGLPVLVYIHGGSLTTGQPSFADYNGESFARRNVVVVNFAYRLGVFGYMAHESLAAESPNGSTGNYGLLDQIQALKWVQANIAAFGGDPDNVTIAGESAGASSVNALCVSPLSEGLFVRAVAESSGITAKVPYHTFRSLEEAKETGEAIRQEFGAADLAALRKIPAERLVNTVHPNSDMTVDGYALTEQPWQTYARGANHETALLQGFNSHEADVFCMGTKVDAENYVERLRPLYGDWAQEAAAILPAAPQDPAYVFPTDRGGSAKGSYNEAVSAAWFTYSHYNWARLLTAQGVPVYSYYFTKDNRSLGPHHSGELPYFYGNLHRRPGLYDARDLALSQQIMDYYLSFLRDGDPNCDNLPPWPSWAQAPNQLLRLDETLELVEDPYLPLYPLIDRYQDALVP